MPYLKNPFALVGMDILHIDKATPSGGPYTCPGCSGSLHYVHESKPVGRAGTRRRAHFAHNAAECSTGFETGLHLWAKSLIAERKQLNTPDFIAEYLDQSFAFEAPFEIADVRIEPWHDGIRPDLVLDSPAGDELHVEIFVTHRVDDEKAQLLEERNTSCLEIDLSEFLFDVHDDEALAEAVIRTAPRHWVHHKQASEWYSAARERWQVNNEAEADRIAAAVLFPPEKKPFTGELRLLEDVIADNGLEPFVDRDVGLAQWFLLPPRLWQAKLLKTKVIDAIQETGDISYVSPAKPSSDLVFNPDRPVEALPLVQSWPGQRPDLELSDPYVVHELEERHPDVGSPRLAVKRYFEMLLGEPDRGGHVVGRRIIEPGNLPYTFRIHRPWADYVARKNQLLTFYRRAGRRRPLGQDDFRTWYKTRLPSGQTPRALTAAGGPEYVRLLARIQAVINMVDGGSVVDDLMNIELPSFRDKLAARAVKPAPLGGTHSQPADQFYVCSSMITFEKNRGELISTLAALARITLGVGADAFLSQPAADLGDINPIEFSVDVPTMQYVIDRLPSPPGKQGRRRLW